jgi:membrane dipeptidase
MIVDAHLDIAWNALAHGRGFEGEPAPGHLVSRRARARAGVGLVFPTLYCAPREGRGRRFGGAFTYSTPGDASVMALAQAGYYGAVGLPLLRDRHELDEYVRRWRRGSLAGVLLMEGADPIVDPSHLGAWVDQGVRVVGLAWGRTRYSGGTGAPGGLTELGHSLLRAMRRRKLILDLSHMAQQAVEEALAEWRGPVMVSHSNARELVPGDRQVSRATVAEVARRGGVVGVSFYRRHLRSDGGAATLEDVVAHVRHHVESAGGPEHVGLGTDLDGGFDASGAPVGKLEEIRGLRGLLRKQFSPSQVDGILGVNWIDFLGRSLP